MKRALISLFFVALVALLAPGSLAKDPASLPNPFYAMDTSFHRPGLTVDQQLDLVKQLGFDGVCWTDEPTAKVAASLASIEQHGLKMYTIYYAAKVTPEGTLTVAPTLHDTMAVLKGHDTIIWIHIDGKGPAFDSLTGNEPLVKTLRELADDAAANGLRIAIYPHIGNWTARFPDATRLAKVVNHKSFGVTFNLCHCLAVGDGDNIPAILDAAGPLLFTATINGADSGVTGGHWDKLIQPLGQGTFDVSLVLRKLKQLGFTGPIGFQGYGIKRDAKTILEPTIQAWKKLSAEAAG